MLGVSVLTGTTGLITPGLTGAAQCHPVAPDPLDPPDFLWFDDHPQSA